MRIIVVSANYLDYIEEKVNAAIGSIKSNEVIADIKYLIIGNSNRIAAMIHVGTAQENI